MITLTLNCAKLNEETNQMSKAVVFCFKVERRAGMHVFNAHMDSACVAIPNRAIFIVGGYWLQLESRNHINQTFPVLTEYTQPVTLKPCIPTVHPPPHV